MRNFEQVMSGDGTGKIKIYAHRGASHAAPENTMAAFRRAAADGADGMELDLMLTSDARIVAIHDDVLGRTCNGSGRVKDCSLAYLKNLDFGSWYSRGYEGEKIPVLEEVLSWAGETGLMLNMEIKADAKEHDRRIESMTADMIKAYGLEERCIVSSFDHGCLSRIKAAYEGIRIAPLYESVIEDVWAYALCMNAFAVHPAYGYIDRETVSRCRRCGLEVNVWTVDDVTGIMKARDMGVSGIITNEPAGAAAILR